MRPFRDLIVWQRAHRLTLEIYRETNNFPREERFGLQSQLRRAAVSIPANIAEGSARTTDAELKHFLSIALGSATEVEYHLLLCHELGYVGAETYEELDKTVSEVKRMLVSFRKQLKAKS